MRKILILTSRFPYPVIGGDRLRIYEICKRLSKNYRLTLISLCNSKSEIEMDVEDDVFESIFRIKLSPLKSIINTILGFFNKKPLQVHYYKSKEYQDKVDNLIDQHDMVLAHLVRTADYVKYAEIPKVLEMTDAISMNYKRIRDHGVFHFNLKHFAYRIEYDRLISYEREIVDHFNLNVLVSKIDKDFLYSDLPDKAKKTLVVSNGVDFNKYNYNFRRNGNTLVFIGNMESEQNLDAAFWFAEKVLQKLRKLDNYQFKVVGRIKEDVANMLENIDGVIVTRAVKSVQTECEGALAGICSVRLAAGVQNKILEYLSMGIPAITTSIGLEGLEATPESDILIADSPEEFVEKVEFLKKNHIASKKIAQNGRIYVEKHHSWGNKLDALVAEVDQLINSNTI